MERQVTKELLKEALSNENNPARDSAAVGILEGILISLLGNVITREKAIELMGEFVETYHEPDDFIRTILGGI